MDIHKNARLSFRSREPGAPGLAVFETWVSLVIQQGHFIRGFRSRPQVSSPRPVREREASFRR